MGSGPPASPQQTQPGHWAMDLLGNPIYCPWDPRFGPMPQSFFSPSGMGARSAPPIVETIKDVTKGELEGLQTKLEPEKRARWAAEFKFRMKLSLPGLHAVLSMSDKEYEAAIEGEPSDLAALQMKYGGYDFKASDAAGARVLYSVIDKEGEDSSKLLHDLEDEPESVRGSGRGIYFLILGIKETDLTRGDDQLTTWKATDWLAKEKCTSAIAIEKRLASANAAYKRIPAKLREIDLSEGGLQVVLKVLAQLPATVKGDSGKPLAEHYRTMMLKKASKGKLMIGEHCEWANIKDFIEDVAIDLKGAGWIASGTGPEVQAFERGDRQQGEKCIICGSKTCRGIKSLKFCPAKGKCGSRFCACCRGEKCYVLDCEDPPTADNTQNARNWPLPKHGLEELQELWNKKASERAAALKDDKEVTVLEASTSPRDVSDWTEIL